MAELYIISASDIVENLAVQMRPVLGEKTEYCNLLPLVEVTLEMLFYGYVMCPEGTSVMMIQRYGFSEEDARRIAEQLQHDVRLPVMRSLPNGIESHHSYSFKITPMADIELLDLGESGPAPSPLQKEIEAITQEIDDGAWVPERMRRMVGR